MGDPGRRRLAELVASAAFTAVALLALWPPGAVYWTALAASVGDAATLAAVCLVAAALGAGFALATEFRVRRIAVGGFAGVVALVLAIESGLSPDSPAHVALYGGLAACLLAGAAAATLVSRSEPIAVP